MCGILGIFNQRFSNEEALEALDLMEHRGPNNTSYYSKDQVFLGHKRLSIIDLDERSNQPFIKKDLIIIFNGEIYNYKELIVEHELSTDTKSDTEVILEMYKKYRSDCLKYLNGMFSFIIFNTSENNFFVARDRLVIKPLYYKKQGNSWIFSSEIASILQISESAYDEFGIRQYKKLRMTLKGYTLYKDIKMFPAAHYMENNKVHRYWDLNPEITKPPNDEEVKHLIEDSVRLRKRSDVPLGSYLSGGLDSTILTAILNPTHTWTVGFQQLNEFRWSELANKKFNTEHHKTLVEIDDFIDTGKWMINKRREPLSVPNEILIYLMTKNVKKKNTVVLSGEGADELFWGYDRIYKWAHEAKALKINEFDEKYCYGSHKDDEVVEFALEGVKGKSVIEKVSYFFQIHHLHGLLRRLDNSTMLNSVEGRVPFCDHRLVELMSSAPSFDWKMGNSFKEPLKRIFKSKIDSKIINRKKVGFPVPLENIFPVIEGKNTPMDRWLKFNLSILKV